MKKELWKILPQRAQEAHAIADFLGLPPLAASVLAARGYGPESAKALLSCEDVLCDPLLMKDLDRAAQTVAETVADGGMICIYGDYDCDGVTSTVMLKHYFDAIGARSCYYIPHREREGYGLNIPAIDELHRLGVDLILTVDNGVTAVEEIAHAYSLGMRVVVTDHHRPGPRLPEAEAVVDPHRSDCGYPFKELSGVGVAFKLLCALEGEWGEALLEQYADLLAIGTVGDVVPLTGENRLFVTRGLGMLTESDRPGIRALLASAGLEGRVLNGDSIAFGLAPRINAAGRLDSADTAAMLMLTEDDEEAAELSGQLEELNSVRRSEEKKIADSIAEQIAADPSLTCRRVLVFSGEGYHAGVVGIVCSRLVERFGKPCLILAVDGASAKGSGRSVEGFSLIEAVAACHSLLARYGGHPMAAGLSLETKEIPAFREAIEQYAAGHCPEMPLPKLTVDAVVSPDQLTVEEVARLSCLEPFGSANPSPTVMLDGMRLERIIPLSEGKHCKLRLSRGNASVQVLCFFTRPDQIEALPGDLIDAACSVSINEYQGQRSVSLRCRDYRLHGCDLEALWRGEQRYERYLRAENLAQDMVPSREETAVIYRYLRQKKTLSLSAEALFCQIVRETPLDYVRFRIALSVMLELGLLEKKPCGEGECLSVVPCAAKVRLENSSILKELVAAI